MELRELARALASLTQEEFAAVTAEARGVIDHDVKAATIRELGRIEGPTALNDDAALTRAALGE